jgi:hypothetical protein
MSSNHQFFFHHQRPTALTSNLHSIPHPATHYLARLASAGVPFLTTDPPWSLQQRDAVHTRSSHRSVAVNYSDFLLQDMYKYLQMGFWTVLPYDAVRHFGPLCLAPAGVIPQRERRPRLIIDYSFYQTNQSAISLQPAHAMQFGKILQRILQ